MSATYLPQSKQVWTVSTWPTDSRDPRDGLFTRFDSSEQAQSHVDSLPAKLQASSSVNVTYERIGQ